MIVIVLIARFFPAHALAHVDMSKSIDIVIVMFNPKHKVRGKTKFVARESFANVNDIYINLFEEIAQRVYGMIIHMHYVL